MFHLLKDTEFNALKKNEVVLDRGIKECLRAKENFGSEDFLRKDEYFETKRCGQLRHIQSVLKNICEIITKQKAIAKNTEQKTEEDLKHFKEDMVTLKSLIDDQKKILQKDLLNIHQKIQDLSAELTYFREKLPCWKQHTKISAISKVPVNAVAKPKEKFQEINNFFDFIHASGGKEGGWRREDHFLFLKFLMKYRRVDVVAKSVNEMLPDISIEEVYNHFRWFVQYQNLLNAKKEVITKWKEEKTSEKKSTNQSVIEKTAETTDSIEKTSCQTSRKSLEERLKLWREQKEKLMEHQKELEKQKLRQQKEREKIRKLKQNEVKSMVNEWKIMKEKLEETKKRENENLKIEEIRNRSRTAKKLIKQFQSMDELRIKKLREQKLKKEKVLPPKRTQSGPLEKSSSQRNPERLLKPTQQWINRVHGSCEEPSYEKPTARTVLKMPKLHIPDWRKTIQ